MADPTAEEATVALAVSALEEAFEKQKAETVKTLSSAYPPLVADLLAQVVVLKGMLFATIVETASHQAEVEARKPQILRTPKTRIIT